MSEDFFAGEPRIGAQFPTIGTKYKVLVLDITSEEQTSLTTGDTITWDDGTPKMQVVIKGKVLEGPTGKYNKDAGKWEAVEDDNGERYLFAKGGLFTAMKNARKEMGFPLEVGAELTVEHTAVGKASQVGWNAPKKFTATYGRPVPSNEDPFAL
jgi:hypothetical protein